MMEVVFLYFSSDAGMQMNFSKYYRMKWMKYIKFLRPKHWSTPSLAQGIRAVQMQWISYQGHRSWQYLKTAKVIIRIELRRIGHNMQKKKTIINRINRRYIVTGCDSNADRYFCSKWFSNSGPTRFCIRFGPLLVCIWTFFDVILDFIQSSVFHKHSLDDVKVCKISSGYFFVSIIFFFLPPFLAAFHLFIGHEVLKGYLIGGMKAHGAIEKSFYSTLLELKYFWLILLFPL